MRLFVWRDVDGTRLVVAAFGALCGLTGVMAVLFKVRQGSVATGGYVISIIGPSYFTIDEFTCFAVTVIPNMLVTGVLAVIVSLLVILWSAKKKTDPRNF